MSGINGLGNTQPPRQLRGVDKDGGGSGGGGYYRPNRDPNQQSHDHDEAEISEEAKKRAEMARMQDSAPARPEAMDARLEILEEIRHFNSLHEQHRSGLRASLKPGPQGVQILHIADPKAGVDALPFGQKDVFHQAPQAVRTRLESFDHSSGSLFDGKV